jgi:hypothetical protein
MSSLTENIALIRAYTQDHEELKQAHHFLYDLRSPPNVQPEFVVMGLNPGELPSDWEKSPTPTEETSQYDFHVERGSGRSAIRWAKACTYFLDGADYVLAELFFWSSANAGKAFEQRFGPLRKSKHLAFCAVLNEQLIRHYQPRAVLLPGIGYTDVATTLYELKSIRTVSGGGKRLIEHMTDGDRSWFITQHWTNARGITNDQWAIVRDYIRAHTGHGVG